MGKIRRNQIRGGFTLIELMVVILIILILAALITTAVVKVMGLGPQLATTNEIRQLTAACEAFKLKYKVYPPSVIFLSNVQAEYTNPANPLSSQTYPAGSTTTLGQYSLAYLYAIWPRLNFGAIDWSGGQGMPANQSGIVLEGDQCLVFFLQGGPNGQGFSTNPQNPMALPAQAAEVRFGPFFTFASDRLRTLAHTGFNNRKDAVPQSFQSFVDPYFTPSQANPYAFFSSGRTSNGYNGKGNTDCPTLNVFPYFQPGAGGIPTYYNPSSVQIISGGVDLVHGRGDAWPGGANASDYTAPNGIAPGNGGSNMLRSAVNGAAGNGYDDLSNFFDNLLGAR